MTSRLKVWRVWDVSPEGVDYDFFTEAIVVATSPQSAINKILNHRGFTIHGEVIGRPPPTRDLRAEEVELKPGIIVAVTNWS